MTRPAAHHLANNGAHCCRGGRLLDGRGCCQARVLFSRTQLSLKTIFCAVFYSESHIALVTTMREESSRALRLFFPPRNNQ